MQGGWESCNVGFSPDEEEKSSTSLGNKIYRNDIPRRNSINHTKGHKSKQFYSKKQETDGRIGICSSRLTSKRTRLYDISHSACHLLWLSKSLYLYHDLDGTQWNSLHYPCFGLLNGWDRSFSCGFYVVPNSFQKRDLRLASYRLVLCVCVCLSGYVFELFARFCIFHFALISPT